MRHPRAHGCPQALGIDAGILKSEGRGSVLKVAAELETLRTRSLDHWAFPYVVTYVRGQATRDRAEMGPAIGNA
jgi:hypothetical protein